VAERDFLGNQPFVVLPLLLLSPVAYGLALPAEGPLRRVAYCLPKARCGGLPDLAALGCA